MTAIINPRHANWDNPTQATDQTGAVVPWDAAADMAAVEIEFDGAAAVAVPTTGAVTSFDLTTLAAYKALPQGSHSLGLAVVTKEGAVSPFAAAVPFLVEVVPLVPKNLVLA